MEILIEGMSLLAFDECFNGAITFSLWKLECPQGQIVQFYMLQWGHNFFVMEIMMHWLKQKLEVELQWGHNFFVMEIKQAVILAIKPFWLQWGHNFFVMEIFK